MYLSQNINILNSLKKEKWYVERILKYWLACVREECSLQIQELNDKQNLVQTRANLKHIQEVRQDQEEQIISWLMHTKPFIKMQIQPKLDLHLDIDKITQVIG